MQNSQNKQTKKQNTKPLMSTLLNSDLPVIPSLFPVRRDMVKVFLPSLVSLKPEKLQEQRVILFLQGALISESWQAVCSICLTGTHSRFLLPGSWKKTDVNVAGLAQCGKQWILDLSCRQDLRVVRSSPSSGSEISKEAAWEPLSSSAPSTGALSLRDK